MLFDLLIEYHSSYRTTFIRLVFQLESFFSLKFSFFYPFLKTNINLISVDGIVIHYLVGIYFHTRKTYKHTLVAVEFNVPGTVCKIRGYRFCCPGIFGSRTRLACFRCTRIFVDTPPSLQTCFSLNFFNSILFSTFPARVHTRQKEYLETRQSLTYYWQKKK